ncbi:MAG TPA: hypothetical protein VGM43_09130 [Bryobacteraceae bacterium]
MGAKVLKWIGYVTAVLSLIAGIRGLQILISGKVESHQKTESLLASEQLQLGARDYESAWQTLEQASQTGGEADKVRDARETLAMEWLENIHVQDTQKFSDIVKKLDPVLTSGAAAAKTPQHKADLLAHLGWSYFLRGRDGMTGIDPAKTYADAVQGDPDNPYAQAMWGHWILWNSRQPANAASHFDAALHSGRQRDFVRHLQLSALLNGQNPACDQEIARVLTAIRKENGSVDDDTRQRLFSLYGEELISTSDSAAFINALAPAEQLLTFHWLFDRLDLGDSAALSRSFEIALLQEAAGQRSEALASFQAVNTQLGGRPGSLLTKTQAAIRRLSRS